MHSALRPACPLHPAASRTRKQVRGCLGNHSSDQHDCTAKVLSSKTAY